MPNDAATTKRTAHEPATARWSQLDISDPAALPEDVRWIPAENKHSERTAAYALAEVFEFAWSSGYLIGDFDGDGACDHLISEGQTLKLSPLELESLGSVLPAATSTPVRPMPMHEVFNSDDPEEIRHRLMYAYRIVSADLDSDGVQALIFAQPGFDSFGDPAFGERGRLHRWTRTGNGYASSDILEGPVSFASILAGPLDFDGDGHSDLAVSAPEERRVFVIRGGVDQPWTTLDAGLRANAIIELDVTKLGPLPGWSLAAVGDLDANGRDELLVSGANGAFVYAGSTSTRPSPAMSIVGDAGDGLFGIGGDFNGDGRADLAIGETLRGRVSIVYGATPMPTGSINLSLPSAGVPQFLLGNALRGLGPIGDLDGDQRADLWVVGLDESVLIYGPRLTTPNLVAKLGDEADQGMTGFRLSSTGSASIGETVLRCDLTGDGIPENAISVSTRHDWVPNRIDNVLLLGDPRP